MTPRTLPHPNPRLDLVLERDVDVPTELVVPGDSFWAHRAMGVPRCRGHH
jgi:hypothetical protein